MWENSLDPHINTPTPGTPVLPSLHPGVLQVPQPGPVFTAPARQVPLTRYKAGGEWRVVSPGLTMLLRPALLLLLAARGQAAFLQTGTKPGHLPWPLPRPLSNHINRQQVP